MKRTIAIAALLLLPGMVFATGFAKQSLFLSKSPVTEGDTVRIYSIVANDTGAKFAGSVVVKDGETKIGTVTVTLDAGATQTVSVAWKPTSGEHKVTAELSTKDATLEQQTAVFSINERPKPVAATFPTTTMSQPAAVESSQGIQNQIGSISPQAQSATAPLFAAFDSFRAKAADLVDAQLAATKVNLAKNAKGGQMAGAQDFVSNPAGGFWVALYTLYLYLLTLVRYIIANPGVFYPFVILAFLYGFWRLFKKFRRN